MQRMQRVMTKGRSSFLLLCGLVCALSGPWAHGQAKRKPAPIAATPPMGWNSWDAYGLTITETQFRDNVQVLASTLKPFGWDYAVIDEGWFLRNPEDRPTPEKLQYELDANGRYIPVPARFPSALNGTHNTGFQNLGAYVHSLGLKFGIHIVRGVPRESVTRNLAVEGSVFHMKDVADTTDACPWDPTNWGVRDTPAGQAWYDSLLRQYAAWGVDYLKVDCIADHPYKLSEIRMIHRAIVHSGRAIVLSLSPGPTSEARASELQQYAQMWRISDDVWDFWKNPESWPRNVYDQFELAAAWVPFSHSGSWPDADMLPLGYLGPNPGEGKARDTRLTLDEQRTMLTLWAIARSPLVLGANLTRLGPATIALLTNRDVLAINQSGHDQMQVSREGDSVVWTSHGSGKTMYLALFNLGDKALTTQRSLGFYGIAAGKWQAHELWTRKDAEAISSLTLVTPPHSCVLYRLDPVQ